MAMQRDGPMPELIRRICLALGILALLIDAFLVGAPFWRNTAVWGSAAILSNIWAYEGLWLTCMRENGAGGINQCNQLSVFGGYQTNAGFTGVSYGEGVYTYVNAFRAMMIIALIFAVIGVVLSSLGMRCTTSLKEDSSSKRWVVIIGGVSHIVTGALTCISVSWYAAEVVHEYYSPYYANQRMKFTLGPCLYVGWVSAALSLVCGFLMACCTCFNRPADTSYKHAYSYAPPSVPEKYAAHPIYKTENYDDYHPSSQRNTSRHSRIKDHYSDRSSSSNSTAKSSRHPSDHLRASGYV